MKRTLIALCFFMLASIASANIYFRGKAAQGGSTANCPVDVTRLMWGKDEYGSGDRIQGQIQLSKMVEEVQSIRIIIQGVDSSGEIVESYACVIGRGGSDYYYSRKSRYPFRGVILLRQDKDRYYIDKELETSWFYFDFTAKPEIKNFLVVNVVLNDREVPFNLRLVGNRLPRTMTTLPKIKTGDPGEFFATTEWVPPLEKKVENELTRKPAKAEGGGNERPVVQLEKTLDEISGETTYTAPVKWGLAVNGANFTINPSVVYSAEGAPRMRFLLSGNSTAPVGYSMRLQKMLFFDPDTKERTALDCASSRGGQRLYLGSQMKQAVFDIPSDVVSFLAKANAIRCRFVFGSPDVAEARNFDFAFSPLQVSALSALAAKCAEGENGR